jgi:hypothetical protein
LEKRPRETYDSPGQFPAKEMILKILRQDAAQVMLVNDDGVIQTFARRST